LYTVQSYIEHHRIERRCNEIVRDLHLRSDYNLIYIEEGSKRFVDSLVSNMDYKATLISIRVRTYSGMSSTYNAILNDTDLEKLKKVDYAQPTLLVDDICDSGRTLSYVQSLLPKDVVTIVLLNKPGNHESLVKLDHTGFQVPGNLFFVGYGMDYNGRYRDLDYIGVISQ
jgi:hypoxanthine phosphoribosyltransferase